MITQKHLNRLSASEASIYNKWINDNWFYDFNNQEEFVFLLKRYLTIRNAKILETGFGDGVILAILEKLGANCHGVEISRGRFQRAEILFKMMAVKPKISLCSLLSLKYPNNYFDATLSISTLEHVAQKGIQPDIYNVPEISDYRLVSQAFSEMVRVTKRGGFIIIHIPNGSSVLQLLSEGHHRLPFLTIMPRKLAELFVVKLVKKDPFYQVGSYLRYKFVNRLIAENHLKVLCIDSKPRPDEILLKLEGKIPLKAYYTKAASYIFNKTGLTNSLLKPFILSKYYIKYFAYTHTYVLQKI